jgi:hypothetical protein
VSIIIVCCGLFRYSHAGRDKGSHRSIDLYVSSTQLGVHIARSGGRGCSTPFGVKIGFFLILDFRYGRPENKNYIRIINQLQRLRKQPAISVSQTDSQHLSQQQLLRSITNISLNEVEYARQLIRLRWEKSRG